MCSPYVLVRTYNFHSHFINPGGYLIILGDSFLLCIIDAYDVRLRHKAFDLKNLLHTASNSKLL